MQLERSNQIYPIPILRKQQLELVAIKARLRRNKELLEASSTLRAAKVVVRDGFSFPSSGTLT